MHARGAEVDRWGAGSRRAGEVWKAGGEVRRGAGRSGGGRGLWTLHLGHRKSWKTTRKETGGNWEGRYLPRGTSWGWDDSISAGRLPGAAVADTAFISARMSFER